MTVSECFVMADDLWSLYQARVGDSDSAHQTSSLTSVGVSPHVYANDRDNPARDTGSELHNVASVVVRPQRLNNITLDCQLQNDDDDDDACYRTLADSMTAGAYQIKVNDRVTVLSR